MKGIRRHLNRRGFTLTEMLIAVAVLSLIGVIVIQVFITAGSLNRKAADVDRAVAVSTAIVERLKALPEDAGLDSQTIGRLFPNAVVSIGTDGMEGTVSILYTDTWEALNVTSSQNYTFSVEARLNSTPPEQGSVTRMVVRVTRQGRYFHRVDAQPLLFELEAALPQALKGGVR